MTWLLFNNKQQFPTRGHFAELSHGWGLIKLSDLQRRKQFDKTWKPRLRVRGYAWEFLRLEMTVGIAVLVFET